MTADRVQIVKSQHKQSCTCSPHLYQIHKWEKSALKDFQLIQPMEIELVVDIDVTLASTNGVMAKNIKKRRANARNSGAENADAQAQPITAIIDSTRNTQEYVDRTAATASASKYSDSTIKFPLVGAAENTDDSCIVVIHLKRVKC